jgi:hypothetical protein
VKDFFGAYGKTAGIGAGAGFLLSLLVGLLSGNPLGIVILRALLLAVLCGGFGAGARVVFGRFLPELTGTAEAGEGTPPTGVNIVLPEENPHVGSPEAAEPDGMAAGDLTGEMAAESPSSESLEPGSAEVDGQPLEAAEEAAGRSPDPGKQRGAEPLPDLDALGSALSTPSGGGRAGTSRPRRGPGSAGIQDGEDPAVIAQAIRTMLKKE